MYRPQIKQIIKDLSKKIVFIVGPRQVGKTWLAKEIGKTFPDCEYLNYDRFEDQQIIKAESWPKHTKLLILDELHKMPGWKNYLKGIFDTRPENLKILVTGSARLDAFRQAGDSLAGRFFAHRLLPFSIAELKESQTPDSLDRLLERGGFPEPFLSESDVDAKRWRNQYVDGLIRNDILSFENINDLQAIKTIFEILRRSVGSPISYSSLARDTGISPATATRYVSILESLFIVFRIFPFSKNIGRSILKSPKVYFFDNALVVGDAGAQFENLVANSLLKDIYARNDCLGETLELKYLRTKEGKEVDFCICRNQQIETAIEAKTGRNNIAPGLAWFCEKYNLHGVQIVKDLKREQSFERLEICNAESYLKKLFA
ncbi:MAG: ATP-binding protein [Candidatus Riflebacteria bacterium]